MPTGSARVVILADTQVGTYSKAVLLPLQRDVWDRRAVGQGACVEDERRLGSRAGVRRLCTAA